jgi:hypothetical protein
MPQAKPLGHRHSAEAEADGKISHANRHTSADACEKLLGLQLLSSSFQNLYKYEVSLSYISPGEMSNSPKLFSGTFPAFHIPKRQKRMKKTLAIMQKRLYNYHNYPN